MWSFFFALFLWTWDRNGVTDPYFHVKFSVGLMLMKWVLWFFMSSTFRSALTTYILGIFCNLIYVYIFIHVCKNGNVGDWDKGGVEKKKDKWSTHLSTSTWLTHMVLNYAFTNSIFMLMHVGFSSNSFFNASRCTKVESKPNWTDVRMDTLIIISVGTYIFKVKCMILLCTNNIMAFISANYSLGLMRMRLYVWVCSVEC